MSRDNGKPDSNRRRFLKSTGGIALVTGLAGCPSGGGEGTGTATDTDTPGGGGTKTDTPGDGMSPTATATRTKTDTPEKVTTQKGGVPQGGTWVIGNPGTPKGLNHLTTSSAYSSIITDTLYESGIYVDPVKYQKHPWLWTDWTIKNVDSGKPDVYWNVRDSDIVPNWTDGEKFGMDDVLFTYNFLLEQNPGNYAAALKPIKTVEKAKNDWDVHMKLNTKTATWDAIQANLAILPKHIWSQVDDYTKYRPSERLEQGEPVGQSYGIVTQYNPNTAVEVKFRPDEEYQITNLQWLKDYPFLRAGGPHIDGLRFKIYSASQALRNALFEGEVDTRYGQIANTAVSRARKSNSIKLIRGQEAGWSYNMFNVRKPPLDDVAFRQVIAMLWDEVLWIRRLNKNRLIDGDIPWPLAYRNFRPEEAVDDAKLAKHPATDAFKFRQSSPGVPDKQGLKKFLKKGKVINGEGGTYVGKKYPGSLTGVKGSQSKAKHNYSWGPVKSEVLRQHGAKQEIRVNGKTITEINGGPLGYHSYPPQVVPEMTTMDQNFVTNMKQMGIPVKRKVLEFNTLLNKVFSSQDYDITHLAIGLPSPYATQYVYSLFHGDNADNLNKVEEGEKKKNGAQDSGNASGYGLPGQASANNLIDKARKQIKSTEKRRKFMRQALERVYLDEPQMVQDYKKILWPVNNEFKGYISGIADPGGINLATQYTQVYKNEQS